MLKDLVRHTATTLDINQTQAKAVLGVVLSSAERQGSAFTDALFRKIPGARTLSARTSDETGAGQDILTRMIEQTPGGRRHVAQEMIRNLQKEGLGHAEIGRLLPAITGFAAETYGLNGHSLMAEIFGVETTAEAPAQRRSVAA